MYPASPSRPPQRRTLMDRRFARTRRAGADRRQAERRGASGQAVRRRWAGPERRQGDRRRLADRRLMFDRRLKRRRDTPVPFTAEEMLRIQRMFQTPGHRGVCPACGAGFTLYPERRRGADAVRKIECSNCGKAAVVSNSWPARLLVVASNADVRSGVVSTLRDAGHDVLEAGDADGGLQAFARKGADVVIVDVSGTAQSVGREFLRRLQGESPGAAVVAMAPRTSYGVADPLAAARQLGAVSTVRVPCSAADLLAAILEARGVGHRSA